MTWTPTVPDNVQAGKVTTGLVDLLQATIQLDPTFILVGDHDEPTVPDGGDAADYANRPRVQVHRVPSGMPPTSGPDAGGFAGQAHAMTTLRFELRAGGGLMRRQVDDALDLALAVVLQRGADRAWVHDITVAGGQTVIDRRFAGYTRVDLPQVLDTFSVSGWVDLMVHAGG